MEIESINEGWYALQVRTRWEGSSALFLSAKGYEIFAPTYRAHSRWSASSKEADAPLFPGYVFCRFDPVKRLPILMTPGVIAVVGRGRTPVPIEASEILSIQSAISSGCKAEPWPYLEVGQRIRIEDDAFGGLEGILVSFKGEHRIVVSVALLRKSVALEIDRSRIAPIDVPQIANSESVGSAVLREVLV